MTAPTTALRLSSALQVVSAAALDDLEVLWRLPPAQLSVALMDVLPSLIETWALASAATAADWYDELRDAEGIGGRFSAIIDDLDDLGGEALAGWANEALAQPEPDLVSARYRAEGGVQKRIANAGNRTVTRSAADDPNARGYMRRTRGGACKFCIMVASRGGVYTKTSSRFACHEHCFCEAVPAWGGRPRPVGPYKPSDRPNNAEERARVHAWIAANL